MRRNTPRCCWAAIWVALAGLAVIAALAALQFFVAARFRRRLNLALAVATLGLIFLTVSAVRLLSGEAAHLQAAKTSGFDLILNDVPGPGDRQQPARRPEPLPGRPGTG